MKYAERLALGSQAKEIWFDVTKRGRVRPTSKQRDIMTQAYHCDVLPVDRDYSVHQWVEDNFPTIGG